MFDKVIYFDICAVPLYIITIATTLSRGMYKGRSNRLYLEVAVFALLADLAELIERFAFYGHTLHTGFVFWVKMSEYCYFTWRNALNVAYLFFVISMTKTWYKIDNIWKRLLIMIPYLSVLCMLIMNEATGWVFTVTMQTGYRRGSHILWVYGFAACYLVIGVLYLIKHRGTLDRAGWIALMSMYFINVGCVVIQYFYPRYLVESFATSLTVLFVVLYVQRPEKQVDMSTGLPGYRAFCEEINKIRVTGHDTRIVIVSLRNAREMSSYLRESYQRYLHLIDTEIRSFAKREGISCEVYFEQPGSFYIILDDEKYNPVQAIPDIKDRVRRAAADILETGAQPDTHIVTVVFPKEIRTIDELLRFGHNFVRFADYGRVFARAGSITEKRDYQIETHIDEILNRAVGSGGLHIRYQPIWSPAEGRYTAAEAVIELSDVVYGSIDSELLISAAEERGLVVSLGRSIIEEVFTFAASDAFKQLGYQKVYIGLTVTQCMRLDLTDVIWNLRERHRVSPAHIAFSIRESGYETMSGIFNENLKKLSAQGYTIILDGFGCGYSNFRHLLDMPISAARVDKSIVLSAGERGGRTILGGIVEMLREIPLKVIAEGADDKETADMLTEMGCDLIQGAYFSAPVRNDELPTISTTARGSAP